jgi:hypothetical protein
MQRFNEFILSAGAIPALAWLNGLSEGEGEINKLLEVSISSGTAALTIIPDRNYSPGVKDEKLKNLYQILELAEKSDLPVFVGTEMNSPGQKFVDAFQSMELKPFIPIFLKGAFIAYAHSVLQKIAGLGYCSNWAKENFRSVKEKNSFYEKVGSLLEPKCEDCLRNLSEDFTPQQIFESIKV